MRVLVFILDNIPFLNATPIVTDRFAHQQGLSSHTPTKKNHCYRNRQGLLCPCDEQLKCHRTFGHSASSYLLPLLRAMRPATISQFSLHYYSNSHSSPAPQTLTPRLGEKILQSRSHSHQARSLRCVPNPPSSPKIAGLVGGVLVVWYGNASSRRG